MKQNIDNDKKDFLNLLKFEINKVENFFINNKDTILNNDKFCLFNLFSILKILKKYKKKTSCDISMDVYNIYFRKSFYLHLSRYLNNKNFISNDPFKINKCSVCYDNNKYILEKSDNDTVFTCESCSHVNSNISNNKIVIELEEITKNTFNPFYIPLIKYPKRCILIGIDGLRPDCLLFSNTPNINKVIFNGVYNFDTKINTDSYSAPSWAAILSGFLQKDTMVYSNEYVEKDNYQWKTSDIFTDLNKKNITTYSLTSSWVGMKHLVKNSKIKIHNSDNNNNIKNDKKTIDDTLSVLKKMNDNSFVFLYLNGVDYSGHKHGFSIQSDEYINSIEEIDNYMEDLINICMNQHISIIITTDHGGSKKSDLDLKDIKPFIDDKSLQPQKLYNGVHGLNCEQHKRVFQIYYGNIVNFEKKEDINIKSNLNIYQKIINYY